MAPVETPTNAKVSEATAAFMQKMEALEAPLEKHLDTRRDFFDKVVVLAGGTIALTVTMLTGIASKKIHPQGMLAIKASWGLLTLSLILAVLRNWLDPEQRITSRLVSTIGEAKALVVELIQAVKPEMLAEFEEGIASHMRYAEQRSKRMTQLYRVITYAGNISVLSLVIGYICLVCFAMVNVSIFLAQP